MPLHTSEPLPYTYHDAMVLLRDADITQFTSTLVNRSPLQEPMMIPGMQAHVVAAAQLCPHNAPYQPHGRPSTARPLNKSESAPIRCELCLDRFSFSGHDAPWCPFLHLDNIKDREIRQRILQFKVTHSIKQDPVPDQLKQVNRSSPHPQPACLPKPIVRFSEVDPIPLVEESASENSPSTEEQDPMIDSGTFDYPLPPSANSATTLDPDHTMDVNCLFEYRALQECLSSPTFARPSSFILRFYFTMMEVLIALYLKTQRFFGL
jgi:hypothetical protein